MLNYSSFFGFNFDSKTRNSNLLAREFFESGKIALNTSRVESSHNSDTPLVLLHNEMRVV